MPSLDKEVKFVNQPTPSVKNGCVEIYLDEEDMFENDVDNYMEFELNDDSDPRELNDDGYYVPKA